ncbi:MAG: hypothetical protein NNA22_02710 [Nitrospira sp.]|nr:hypothetical protein [Nitrospira sp.]
MEYVDQAQVGIDGGAVLLKALDARLPVTDPLAGCLVGRRDSDPDPAHGAGTAASILWGQSSDSGRRLHGAIGAR